MSTYPRKSPPAPKRAPAKQELKIIQCAHILHDHASAWSAIDIGDRRAVALCKHCEESITGRVLSALYKEAIVSYMKPYLDAANKPKEAENANDLHSDSGPNPDTAEQS